MAEDYYHKFKIIFERERSMAKGLAVSLIRFKTLTVWEIMIPVIFILNYVKLKQSREIFIQNQIFTKKMALDAALDMKKKGASKDTIMMQIKAKTKELLTSVPGGIYSDDIRRQQLKEIELLVDHYTKLLNAEGQDYASLVTSAYQSAREYNSFFRQLKSAEKEVMSAAQRTLGSQTDMAAAQKIESLTDRMRAAEMNKIFSSDFQPQDAE
ncbi:MAG: NF038143 family protein [Desulfobacterales bacterium]